MRDKGRKKKKLEPISDMPFRKFLFYLRDMYPSRLSTPVIFRNVFKPYRNAALNYQTKTLTPLDKKLMKS